MSMGSLKTFPIKANNDGYFTFSTNKCFQSSNIKKTQCSLLIFALCFLLFKVYRTVIERS